MLFNMSIALLLAITLAIFFYGTKHLALSLCLVRDLYIIYMYIYMTQVYLGSESIPTFFYTHTPTWTCQDIYIYIYIYNFRIKMLTVTRHEI